MKKEEYYNRMGKINARISTDRVDEDEGKYLLLQKLYLKDRYIETLENENERLNNTIKELEKYMKEERINNGQIDEGTIIEIQMKLQELKEGK